MSPFLESRIFQPWFAAVLAIGASCAAAKGQDFSANSFGASSNVTGNQHAHEFSDVAGEQPPLSRTAPIPTNWPTSNASFDSHVQTASREAAPERFNPAQPENLLPPQPSGSGGSGSLESWIDKAGPAIAGVQETLNEKTGGWLGKITSKFSGGGGGKFDITRMLASLALVVGCYLSFVWLMRKMSPGGNRQLPAEVVQVLGRMPFGVKEHLQLVRLGNKLVLLLTSLDHTQPIGEVTDPQEVEYLTSLCQSGKRGRGKVASAVSQTLRNRSSNPASANAYPISHAAASSSMPQPAMISAADRYQSAASANESANAGLINVLRSLENTIRSRPNSTMYEA